MHGIVVFILLGGLLAGLAYGFAAGTFKTNTDVVNGMKDSMKSLALFMVLVFFAAQFVAFVQRYDPKAGLGSVIATMLPYSMAFLLSWMLLLALWLMLGLPLGPGAGLFLSN